MRGFTLCLIYKLPVKHHESRRDLDDRDLDNDPDLDRYRYRDCEHDFQSEQDQPFTPRK